VFSRCCKFAFLNYFTIFLHECKISCSSYDSSNDFSKTFESKWLLQFDRIFCVNAFIIFDPLSVINLILAMSSISNYAKIVISFIRIFSPVDFSKYIDFS